MKQSSEKALQPFCFGLGTGRVDARDIRKATSGRETPERRRPRTHNKKARAAAAAAAGIHPSHGHCHGERHYGRALSSDTRQTERGNTHTHTHRGGHPYRKRAGCSGDARNGRIKTLHDAAGNEQRREGVVEGRCLLARLLSLAKCTRKAPSPK